MDGIASSVPLIARPSFDRACSFVPSEYVQAWEWFLREIAAVAAKREDELFDARGAAWRLVGQASASHQCR